MDRSKEKTTAPYPPVGPDGGQPLFKTTTQSITEGQAEHKPPEEDLTKNEGQIGRVVDPVYLPQNFPKIPLLGLVFGMFLCYTLFRCF